MSERLSLPAGLARWLEQRDIPALAGWSGEAHPRVERPTVVVTAREYEAGTGGFFHYLGERYNEDTAAWEECYGRKLRVSLGLDIYWPETGREKDSQQLLEKLVQVLTLERPEGLGVEQVTCGETLWEEEKRLLKREVTVKCTAWLVAQADADGEFLDFELRGGWKI